MVVDTRVLAERILGQLVVSVVTNDDAEKAGSLHPCWKTQLSGPCRGLKSRRFQEDIRKVACHVSTIHGLPITHLKESTALVPMEKSMDQ